MRTNFSVEGTGGGMDDGIYEGSGPDRGAQSVGRFVALLCGAGILGRQLVRRQLSSSHVVRDRTRK
ncbi:MAG: complex I NDUFA9 subunit family protein, partial [Gluconobacter oxydans]